MRTVLFYYSESKIEVYIVSVSIPFIFKLFIFIACNKNLIILWSTYPKTITSFLFHYQIYVAVLCRQVAMNTTTDCITTKWVQCALYQSLICELHYDMTHWILLGAAIKWEGSLLLIYFENIGTVFLQTDKLISAYIINF